MSEQTGLLHEDVAHILRFRMEPASASALYVGGFNDAVRKLAEDFADLFAADNPPYCIHCGAPAITDEVCVTAGGRPYDEHLFEGGFNRGLFLAACGV